MELCKTQVLREQGYEIHPQLISSDEVNYYKNLINQSILTKSSPYGIRNLQNKIPEILKLAYHQKIITILTQYFQQDFQLVRATYFNKTREANWGVAWHQDKTIAVEHKIELPGFKAWSVKDNIIHVQPPLDILQSMLAIRIHLDRSDKDTGPLQIIPKSHLLGILSQEKIEEIKNTHQLVSCQVNAGDGLIMSPLILHRSLKALNPNHRRVIHLEYSCAKLP